MTEILIDCYNVRLPYVRSPIILCDAIIPNGLIHTQHHGCTNCGGLAAWLRENGERMRKSREMERE